MAKSFDALREKISAERRTANNDRANELLVEINLQELQDSLDPTQLQPTPDNFPSDSEQNSCVPET